MTRIFLLLFSTLLTAPQAYSQSFEIKSPNEKLKLEVNVNGAITWSVFLNDNNIIENSKAAMDFSSGPDFGINSKVKSHTIKNFSSVIYPAVPHKDAEIEDEFVELSLIFRDKYQLKFRAYDDGVAYQFVDDGKINREVITEQVSLTFPEGTMSYFAKEESMYSHNERDYLNLSLTDITANEFCSLPALFITDHGKVLFTETALHHYPGMFVRGNGTNTMDALFPKFVLEAIPDTTRLPDRHQKITKEADYIAQTTGKRAYPWRVFIISDDDRTFVESNLTFQLAQPSQIEDTKWIKPGKVAWDWYNANNIYGVDFESGLNTATYKYYIDFAAANKIEYVILDEGWTKSTTEIVDFNPDIDVQELIKYAEAKSVGIVLWVLWKPLHKNIREILETYKSWGAEGIKVDFMQRNDQSMVSSYEDVAEEAARLELLVDFHGAFKPSGLRRTYPNILNYEGVKGSEHNKWSDDITPDHNLIIPFVRMAAGPMDYTPGAMSNRQKDNYSISWDRPMSLGTRSHQVAMYVIYEAPFQMLCESPSRYIEEQETVDFIVRIPTTWDETVVLHGSIGNYIAVARRKGVKWYLAAMTNWEPRDLELDLSFLREGTYKMEVFKDGVNTNRFAEDYSRETSEVNSNSKVRAKMAKGGGWTAIISKQDN